MDTLMDGFVSTPLVMTLPKELAVKTLWYFRLGFGDLVVPGILLVAAVRISHRRGELWPVLGTSLGTCIGFAIGIPATFYFNQPMPMLIFLVPAACLGYGASLLLARKQSLAAVPLDATQKT